ncbi:MAG: hypothetical protein N2595_04435 [bacterium]|nr:hypothetical protein [bacterium]
MSADQFMRYVVMVAGVSVLIKGVILVLWPGQLGWLLRWWLRLPVNLLRALGVLMIVCGVVCIGVAAVRCGNHVVAATSVVGTFLLLAGFVYQAPTLLRETMPGLVGNAVLARVWGVLALIVGVLLLFIAVR